MLKIDPQSCPMCGRSLRFVAAENATSRFYPGLYICSSCGVEEALAGKPRRVFEPREVGELRKQQSSALGEP